MCLTCFNSNFLSFPFSFCLLRFCFSYTIPLSSFKSNKVENNNKVDFDFFWHIHQLLLLSFSGISKLCYSKFSIRVFTKLLSSYSYVLYLSLSLALSFSHTHIHTRILSTTHTNAHTHSHAHAHARTIKRTHERKLCGKKGNLKNCSNGFFWTRKSSRRHFLSEVERPRFETSENFFSSSLAGKVDAENESGEF